MNILTAAIEDILVSGAAAPLGPLLRAGPVTVPRVGVEVVELGARNFQEHRAGVMAVQIERYGSLSHYPPNALQEGRRPLLQFPAEAFEGTLANPRAVGLALVFSGRLIAYAVGSPLENYDEEWVHDDPHFGEHQTYYLQALAVHPSVENAAELEHHLLERLRTRVIAHGYDGLSAFLEERFHQRGPAWLRPAEVLRVVDNYLRSGLRFVYLHLALAPGANSPSEKPAR